MSASFLLPWQRIYGYNPTLQPSPRVAKVQERRCRLRSKVMLRVTEIYKSIQGESSYAGFPCIFIRLTGCSLRCRWCDTTYGFHGGTDMEVDAVLARVQELGVSLVELTGGEPLEQADAIPLMRQLVDAGLKVLIETSGAVSIAEVPPEVHVIMDLKCPDSKMSDRNHWPNIALLKPSDEIKFVIASRADFDWAAAVVRERRLRGVCGLLFSPAFGLTKNQDLAEWIVESGLPVRMQLQMHKYIWHPRAKGV